MPTVVAGTPVNLGSCGCCGGAGGGDDAQCGGCAVDCYCADPIYGGTTGIPAPDPAPLRCQPSAMCTTPISPGGYLPIRCPKIGPGRWQGSTTYAGVPVRCRIECAGTFPVGSGTITLLYLDYFVGNPSKRWFRVLQKPAGSCSCWGQPDGLNSSWVTPFDPATGAFESAFGLPLSSLAVCDALPAGGDPSDWALSADGCRMYTGGPCCLSWDRPCRPCLRLSLSKPGDAEQARRTRHLQGSGFNVYTNYQDCGYLAYHLGGYEIDLPFVPDGLGGGAYTAVGEVFGIQTRFTAACGNLSIAAAQPLPPAPACAAYPPFKWAAGGNLGAYTIGPSNSGPFTFEYGSYDCAAGKWAGRAVGGGLMFSDGDVYHSVIHLDYKLTASSCGGYGPTPTPDPDSQMSAPPDLSSATWTEYAD